jgi:hypothetical protein
MSNEIIRISNMAKQYEKVDTVMYALNKVWTKKYEFHKKLLTKNDILI